MLVDNAGPCGGAPLQGPEMVPAKNSLGTPGIGRAQELPGGMPVAQALFDQYAQYGTDITPEGFGGQRFLLPDGSIVQIRYVSGQLDPAVEFNGSVTGSWKIHFGFGP